MRNSSIVTRILLCFMLIVLVIPYSSTFAESNQLAAYSPIDIDNHWAHDALWDFVQADILIGYTDQNGVVTIKPNSPISRSEFVALLVRSLNLTNNVEGKTFVDVPQNEWYYDPIRIVSSLHIVDGINDSRFAPSQFIKRSEIAAIIGRAFSSSISFDGQPKQFPDVLPNNWAKSFIDKVSQAGIIDGNEKGFFNPDTFATRAEAITMLYRALHKQTNDLTDNSTLNSVIFDSTRSKEDLVSKDVNFDRLYNYNNRFYTGFYKAGSDMGTDRLKQLIDSGMKIGIMQYSSPTIWSMTKWNNFAMAELKQFTYQISSTRYGIDSSTIKNISGYVYLKKMSDGSWKIYGYTPTVKNHQPWETADPITLLKSLF